MAIPATLTDDQVRTFDNSTPAAQNAQIAERIQNLEGGEAGAVLSVAGRGGAVVLVSADISDATAAATASKIAIRGGAGQIAFAAVTATTVAASGAITGASAAIVGAVTGATVASTGNMTAGALKVVEGANKTMGVATLSSGAVTVSTTAASATMRVIHSRQTAGTLPGHISVANIIAGTSFDLVSTAVTDDAIIAWLIVEPA